MNKSNNNKNHDLQDWVDALENLIFNGKSYKIKQTDTIQDTILKEKILDFNS